MWGQFYKKGGIRRLMLALTSRGVSTVCPFCRDEFADEETPWACTSCSTQLHLECFQELGRCTTLGCRATATIRQPPRVRARARQTFEEINERLDALRGGVEPQVDLRGEDEPRDNSVRIMVAIIVALVMAVIVATILLVL